MPSFFKYIAHLRPWDVGQVGLGQVGCREGWIQERTDAGKDGCRIRRMHERRDAERRESRLEGYKKGWFRTGEIRNGRDSGQEG